jgi:predicted RNase H-like HicB family nuclease
MKFVITLEQDEMGMFVVQCPSIPGCVSQGATEDEAMDHIKQAISVCWRPAPKRDCR